jgi:hypothetical protein
MRFKFTQVSNEFYTVSTEASTEVLTVSGGSPARGAAVVFAPNTGADYQLWQVVDLGDGYCKLVAKHSGLVLGHTIDTTVTDPINNDGTGTQLAADGADNTEWLIAESHPLPYANLGVNQNGWSPAQKKGGGAHFDVKHSGAVLFGEWPSDAIRHDDRMGIQSKVGAVFLHGRRLFANSGGSLCGHGKRVVAGVQHLRQSIRQRARNPRRRLELGRCSVRVYRNPVGTFRARLRHDEQGDRR